MRTGVGASNMLSKTFDHANQSFEAENNDKPKVGNLNYGAPVSKDQGRLLQT
jgi:hypothetical protein